MTPKFVIALLAACAFVSAPRAEEAPPPYTLKNTEVRSLHAAALGRDYELYVYLPPSYAKEPDRRYPVVFVTDANYAFPLIRAIAPRVGDMGRGLDDFILVGLSYAVGETGEYSRRRDYTPSPGGPKNAVSDMPDRAPVFGEVEPYRQFVANEVIPFVEKTYRIDPDRMIFAGHSYGALFGLHALLTEPAMFDSYILGSPSLWFDDRIFFAREKAYAETHKDLPAKLFMAVGGFETIAPGSGDERYNTEEDMVADLKAFEQALRSRGYQGLTLATEVIPNEDHLSVAPAIITHGLIWALKPKR